MHLEGLHKSISDNCFTEWWIWKIPVSNTTQSRFADWVKIKVMIKLLGSLWFRFCQSWKMMEKAYWFYSWQESKQGYFCLLLLFSCAR